MSDFKKNLVERFRRAVQKIKARADYNEATGQALAIEGSPRIGLHPPAPGPNSPRPSI